MQRALAPAAIVLAFAAACGGDAAVETQSPPPIASGEAQDLALHCLVRGQTTPPIDSLCERDLTTWIRLLGGALETYLRADFGTFCAMRRADLGFANAHRRAAELDSALNELGAASVASRGDWIATLGEFWSRYYDRPPVARWRPEATRAREAVETAPQATLAAWERSFTAQLEGQGFVEHHLAVPHRRELGEIARAAPLAWIDFDVQFEGRDGSSGRLLLRYVWDSVDSEWFLHRAVTRFDEANSFASSRRNLIL
jgi:hypothetical protein